MRVAVVGGGFYGCYIANMISRLYGPDIRVEIFEQCGKLLSRAATNNQCRLHLGFHYPRSKATMVQTVRGFNAFSREFRSCIDYPKENLYAIHKEGHIGFEQYLSAVDECCLQYDIVDKVRLKKYFRNIDQIEGVVRVKEGVIRLNDIARLLLSRLDAKVHYNRLVTAIDSQAGKIISAGRDYGSYDLIFNTTHNQVNLGLSQGNEFDLKYELAAILMMDAPFGEDVALTLMDGPFVSLYPAGYGRATLSSVIHSPFFKSNNVEDLEKKLEELNENFSLEHAVENILSHGNEILNLCLHKCDIRDVWVAPKSKMSQDHDDQRVAKLRVQERLVSVFCGKLDAIHEISEKVKILIDSKLLVCQ